MFLGLKSVYWMIIDHRLLWVKIRRWRSFGFNPGSCLRSTR